MVGARSGYIFMVTLFMLAGMTAIATYVYMRGTAYIPFMNTMIDQHKAKLMALGGLQIGIQQLTYVERKEDTKSSDNNKQGQQQESEAQQLYMRLMPALNRWQVFELRKAIDGIDAVIRLCIVCEEGKLDLNQIYDFKRKQFKGQGQAQGDMKKVMELVCKRIESIMGMRDLLPALEQMLKKRGYPLNDVTQLLTLSEWATFNNYLFYEPSQETKVPEKPVLYLTDIFTIYSGTMTIEPRLFSNAWLGIMGMPQAYQGQVKERAELIKKISKQFKQTVQWKTDWNTQLKPIYQKELQSLPKGLDSVLSVNFDPRQFLIRIDATVGTITQRLIAVVERVKKAQAEKSEYEGVIKKMYWL